MMRCPHCDAKREATAAYLASIGCANWIEWAAEPIDTQKSIPTWRIPDDGTMSDCRCNCHSWARIAGILPKLKDQP